MYGSIAKKIENEKKKMSRNGNFHFEFAMSVMKCVLRWFFSPKSLNSHGIFSLFANIFSSYFTFLSSPSMDVLTLKQTKYFLCWFAKEMKQFCLCSKAKKRHQWKEKNSLNKWNSYVRSFVRSSLYRSTTRSITNWTYFTTLNHHWSQFAYSIARWRERGARGEWNFVQL